ncbi:UbiX family flavin prenyltransferase [Geobacter argillaceus]|uniref:Flavin prenyltransferase UbiX n=1 Tax=Geobacter argillaceus TaxID=345631 RepID=A0A562VNV0_9BACT|nr:flavin prenyltransferase UbiX [Geobacter argillaceus]TWJ19580.1 4-hydroxy-3-polyprenylbenzoate decarboxylase [Geobacter argillaceus]
MTARHIVLAITGASGALYGLRLTEELLRSGIRVTLLISRCGFTVLREECGLDWEGAPEAVTEKAWDYFAAAISMGRDETVFEPVISYYAEDDFIAPVASGSSAPDAMVVAPCSMGSLARIAAGLSGTLLERTADCMHKEGRPLLLVPRETPLSAIHLENMLKLARLGVRIVPAMPGFYGKPETMDDLVDFMVGKVLDQLGVEHLLFQRWGV